jgi:nitrite reductase/ring-hydroxylating ferredoxin subunit
MNEARQIDVERVICRLDDIEASGARGFAIGSGDWPLRGFVVRVNDDVRGFINHCPHAGHPLNLRPHRFLTADSSLILCSSHGALFEKATGLCVAGPCAGHYLRAVPLKVESGFVMLADGADPVALAAASD